MLWNTFIDVIFEVSEIIIVFWNVQYFLFLLFEHQRLQGIAKKTRKENLNIYALTTHDLDQTLVKQ